jgi:pyridoxamine 5'-phosphate oxidase
MQHAPAAPIDFDHPSPDPLPLVRRWLIEAEVTGLPNPNAMTLATVNPAGQPSARIVLLRGLDERGAVFYSNRRSRKGRELAEQGRAALLFHWDPLDRQIRIEGQVSPVGDEESDAYFAGRPRESQLNAWASDQSEPVANRATLLARQQEMRDRYEGRPVPRPPHWGGFRVSLQSIELWQGDRYRMHDRVVYTRGGGAWSVVRLCP